MISVLCDICLREALAVRVKGKVDIPPGWVALSATCCPHQEVYACENPPCQQRAARALMSKHTSETLQVRQTTRQQPQPTRPAYWTDKIR